MDIFTSPEALALIPLVVGLVEVLKGIGIPAQYAPVASIALGIAFGFLVFPTVATVVLGGIAIGLAASGLYSGVRAMAAPRFE